MALEDRIDLGAQPRSVTVEGAGGQSLTFPIPAAVLFELESVRVEVDTSGAGPTTATLSIADQSGQVIATKRQTETIDAGASGSATWALRLADEAGAAPSGGGLQFETAPQAGLWFYAESTNGGAAPNGLGFEWFDTGGGVHWRSTSQTTIDGDAGLILRSFGGDAVIFATSPGSNIHCVADARITLDTGHAFIYCGGALEMGTYDTASKLTVGAGKQFTIVDSAGTKLVEVRDDQSLHIKSAWIIDL